MGSFQEVRRICDKYDVLFIADEVIMGLGRTGAPFAIQHWGIEPDFITTAKGLCAGYGVLAAVIYFQLYFSSMLALFSA